jgi:hypothetical protein
VNLEYEWSRPYVAAVLEADRSRLAHRVEEANSAIKARINELEQDHMGTPEERMAIEDALSCLDVLRREATYF